MNINEVIQTGNPYYGPIKHISAQLNLVERRFPFLALLLSVLPLAGWGLSLLSRLIRGRV